MKLISIVLIIFVAHASNSEEVKKYESLDLKQFDEVDSKPKSNSKMKFTINCKTEDGKELKSNETGYDQCMKAKSNTKPLPTK